MTEVLGEDLPAYVSNGLVGLRVLDIPLLPGVTLVNGFAAPHPVVEVEAAARAPYPLAGDIRLDGVRLRRSPQAAQFVDQGYDFASGEVVTRFRYSAGGVSALATVTTLCSRSRPTLVLQEVSVQVDRACDLVLACMIDPLNVHGRMASRHVDMPAASEAADGSMAWQPMGGTSLCGMAYVTEFEGDLDALRERPDGGNGAALVTQYSVRAVPGRTYLLRQITSVVPDVLHAQPEHEAVRLVSDAAEIGFAALRQENAAIWSELWRGRPIITADDDRWQRLADAAFFYLNSSVHASAPCSTSIYGLAQWDDYHYYYGHVMWDIETFSLPPLLMCQPEAARSLLEYRTQTIPAARSNAKLVGRSGLQYPWESGPLHGQEASPGAGSASWYEDHVSPDIALAFAAYGHATGDRRFMSTDAAPVLYGVADWIVSRVSRTERGFELRRSMGIAERAKPADNDAYTIMVMRRALDEAIDHAERSGDPVSQRWRKVVRRTDDRPVPLHGRDPQPRRLSPERGEGRDPRPARRDSSRLVRDGRPRPRRRHSTTTWPWPTATSGARCCHRCTTCGPPGQATGACRPGCWTRGMPTWSAAGSSRPWR